VGACEQLLLWWNRRHGCCRMGRGVLTMFAGLLVQGAFRTERMPLSPAQRGRTLSRSHWLVTKSPMSAGKNYRFGGQFTGIVWCPMDRNGAMPPRCRAADR